MKSKKVVKKKITKKPSPKVVKKTIEVKSKSLVSPIKYAKPVSSLDLSIVEMKKDIAKTYKQFLEYYNRLIINSKIKEHSLMFDLEKIMDINDEFGKQKLKLLLTIQFETSPLKEQLEAMERRINNCIFNLTEVIERPFEEF